MLASARADGMERAKDAIWRRWMAAPYTESDAWRMAHSALVEMLLQARTDASRLHALATEEILGELKSSVVDSSLRRLIGGF